MKRAVILFGAISLILLLIAVTFKSLGYPVADFMLKYGAIYNCLASAAVLLIIIRSPETGKKMFYYGTISFFCFNGCLFLYKINFGALPLLIGSAIIVIFIITLTARLLKK